MTAALGLLYTAWSWIRSSRVGQIALLVGAVLVAIFLYGRKQRSEGYNKAMQRQLEQAVKRIKRSQEIHDEIRSLPLSDRARRLRELDTPG